MYFCIPIFTYINSRMKVYILIKSWFTLKKNILAVVFVITGAAGGFLYYYLVGCRTGTCPITSSPWLSMLWGATVGYLISDIFRKKETSHTDNKGDKI
jgi:hypothetical protein